MEDAVRRHAFILLRQEQRLRATSYLVAAWKAVKSQEPTHEHRRSIKILVVDDDAQIASTIAEILYEEGYWPIVASDGQEAFTRLGEHRDNLPKLIILDLMMPVMDGWTFLELQAENPEFRHIPTLVISAHRKTHPNRTVDPTVFLDKPFNLDRFLPIVEKLTGTAT